MKLLKQILPYCGKKHQKLGIFFLIKKLFIFLKNSKIFKKLDTKLFC